MGDIINMTIQPKTSSHRFAGQNYTITYDPTARRWVWVINFVETFRFFGDSDTEQTASRNAQRKINSLIKTSVSAEENNAI